MKIKYFLFFIVLIVSFNISILSANAVQTIDSSKINEQIITTIEDELDLTETFENSVVENLTTTTLSATSIKLSWSELDHATSYEVYQSINSDNDFKLIDNVSSSSYTIQNLVPGETNYFKVRAVQDFEDTEIYSQFSSSLSAVTSFNAPSNLKVTNKTYNSISLSWDKVADAEGYEILRATSKNGTYTKVNSTTATSFKDSNLTTNKTYYYKIRAYTGKNLIFSAYSTSTNTKISFATPSNLKVTSKTYNSISLSWSKVEGAEGYEVWMATSKNGKYTKVNTTKATTFKHTNLSLNKTYYYKIRAYTGNKKINSSYSSITNAKTALDSPSNFKVGTKTYNSVSLSWNKVSGAGYEIWMASSKDGKYTKLKTTTATSFKHTNLTTNKTYYYKIRSYVKIKNKTYYSSYSKVINGKPQLDVPKSLKTTGANDSIKISWGTVSGATNYKVYRATSKNGDYKLLTTTKSNSYTDKSVTKRKTYYYKIVASRTVGKNVYNSASSAIVSGITKVILKPDIYIWATDETYQSTNGVAFYLENHGSKPIKILSTGALIDDDYEDFDRLLQLIDIDTFEDLIWHEIGANGYYDYVAFRVIGSNTWYDQYSTICFEFTYDGVEYTGFVSNFYGFTYIENK